MGASLTHPNKNIRGTHARTRKRPRNEVHVQPTNLTDRFIVLPIVRVADKRPRIVFLVFGAVFLFRDLDCWQKGKIRSVGPLRAGSTSLWFAVLMSFESFRRARARGISARGLMMVLFRFVSIRTKSFYSLGISCPWQVFQ